MAGFAEATAAGALPMVEVGATALCGLILAERVSGGYIQVFAQNGVASSLRHRPPRAREQRSRRMRTSQERR